MSTPAIEPTGSDRARIQPPAPYLLERGFPELAILEAGWRVEPLGDRYRSYGSDLPPEAASSPVWLIPYRHANGHVAFERIRFIESHDVERWRKYRQPAGRGLALYDPYLVLGNETFEPRDCVLLIEGEANAVAAHTLLPDLPVIGLPGQKALTQKMAEQLAHIPVIYLWIDRHDPAAEQNAQRIAERLRDAGNVAVHQLPPAPDRMDANDVLREFEEPEASRQLVRGMLDAAEKIEPAIDEDWLILPDCTAPHFPVDALPPEIAEFVKAVAANTQTPPDMPAVTCVGVLNTAAMSAQVDLGAWDEGALGLYILGVSPSGDHKSAVLNHVAKPLKELNLEARREAKEGKAEWESRRELLQVQKQALTAKAKKLSSGMEEPDGDAHDLEWGTVKQDLANVLVELEELGEKYAPPRLLADDATPEALAALMSSSPNGIAIASAEATVIQNVLGHYSDQSKPNLGLVVKALNGEGPYDVDRSKGEPIHIPRPLLSMTLLAQPHVLRNVVGHETANDQGFVGRLLVADFERSSSLGRRDQTKEPPRVPDELAQQWDRIVKHLRALCADKTDTTARGGGFVGFVSTFVKEGVQASFSLSSSSKRLLRQLMVDLEPRLRAEGDLRPFADWVARYVGFVGRIATVLHLVTSSAEEPVGEDAMRRALAIGDYFLAHMQFARSVPDPLSRRALAWLQKPDTPDPVSHRDLQRGTLHGRGTAPAAAELAQELCKLGAIRPVAPEAAKPQGGRPPSPRYEINPRLRATCRES